ncbi:MAG: response regulator [Candidatus Zixiibacteriota bacterium]|nr:MAG: response regulator [candidate division Zixibacteria bacterium]
MAAIQVLIVDDEEEFANTLAERMRNRDIKVNVVGNGEDAIASVSKTAYDAIILDLIMPGLDGIETLKQILSINPDLQVILLTGRGTVSKSVEALKIGAFEFLEKPIKFDDLLGKIDNAKSLKTTLSEKRTQEMIDKIIGSKGW